MGIIVGVGALAAYQNVSRVIPGLRVAQVILAFLSLALYVFIMFQRYKYREVFSFFFGIAVVLSHVPLIIVLFLNEGRPGSFIFAWFFTNFLGELTRVFTYLFPPPKFNVEEHAILDAYWKLWLVSAMVLLVHVVGWIVQVVVWQSTYIEN